MSWLSVSSKDIHLVWRFCGSVRLDLKFLRPSWLWGLSIRYDGCDPWIIDTNPIHGSAHSLLGPCHPFHWEVYRRIECFIHDSCHPLWHFYRVLCRCKLEFRGRSALRVRDNPSLFWGTEILSFTGKNMEFLCRYWWWLRHFGPLLEMGRGSKARRGEQERGFLNDGATIISNPHHHDILHLTVHHRI